MSSPQLSQSTSFSSGEKLSEKATPQTTENAAPPKRLSGEAKEPKVMARRKTGLSSFMSSLVGSPRQIKISAPENPVHVTHVGYDNDTGKFIVGYLTPAPALY
jgi:p21-activated kinase 1